MQRVFGVLLVLFLVMGGCAAYKAPVVTVNDLNLVSLDGGGAGMELYLTVHNPNSFDVKLLGYNYDLRVMALPFARGGGRDEISFPGEDSTNVRIPIRVAYGDLVEVLKRRPDPDSIPYQLRAGLELGTPVGLMTVPVNKKGSYAIPKEFRPSFLLGRIGEFLHLDK